jgi:hypothetical protein
MVGRTEGGIDGGRRSGGLIDYHLYHLLGREMYCERIVEVTD